MASQAAPTTTVFTAYTIAIVFNARRLINRVPSMPP